MSVMVQPSNEATRQDSSGGPLPTEQHDPADEPSSMALDRTPGRGSSLPASPPGPAEERDDPEGLRFEHLAQLLSFAPWEEIWKQVSPSEVAAHLDELDLPESLTRAWSRWLAALDLVDDR